MHNDRHKYNEAQIAIINKKTAVISLITAIIGLFCGFLGGNVFEKVNVKNEIDSAINIYGNGNEVIINNIESLVGSYFQLKSDYEELQQQNNYLVGQNAQLTDDINEAYNLMNSNENQTSKELEDLKTQLNDIPSIDYRNLALCVDVIDIPINSNKSVVIIDGRDYFSKEIVEKLIPDDKSFTIKNDTIFIGRVIADKINLFSLDEFDSSLFVKEDTITDSFNNNYTNAAYFKGGWTGEKYVMYILDRKYSYLKLNIAATKESRLGEKGTLIIKADDEVVYTSPELDKETEPYIQEEIPINNCMVLSIEFSNGVDQVGCIISDVIVYN